jgi:predicted transcriptional regulator
MLKKQKLDSIIKKEKKVNEVSEEMSVSRQTVSKWLQELLNNSSKKRSRRKEPVF